MESNEYTHSAGKFDINWTIEKRKISSLKDYHKNPRKISKEQEEKLKASLCKFGLIDKPIINTDNVIIGGHQRKKTLKKLGFKEIEVYVPHRELTEKEVEELNITLNRVHGDFDLEILSTQFNAIDLVNWGFNLEELKLDDMENIENKKEKENNHLKTCPSCGYEF